MTANRLKKLLFVIDSFNIGGAERSLSTLLNLLPSGIFEIDVMVTSRGGALEKQLPPGLEITLIPVCGNSLSSRLRYLASRLRFALSLRLSSGQGKENPSERFWRNLGRLSASPQKSYDIAVAYQQGFPTYYVATKVQAAKKIAWINADLTEAGFSESFNLPFYNIYNNVVAVSAGLRDIMTRAWQLPSSKMRVINDINSTAVIRRLAGNKNPYPEKTGSGQLNLLTVGRLVPVKGHELLIKAAAILRDKGVDFRWHIIGDGPMRSELERLIIKRRLQNHVSLLGALDNPYPWISNCDIYVQPSYSEGYGIAVCEAKAFCRPIILTDFKVASGLIDNGQNGLIVRMTPEAIAGAVIQMTGSGLRKRFSSALSACSSDNSAGSLAKIMDLLTAKTPQP